jgi:carboxypeptidase PM20D1
MGILLTVLAVIIVLVAVVLARTFAFNPPRSGPVTPYDPGEVDEAVLARLSKAISIPTVCAQNYDDTNFAPFDEYIDFIQNAFPLFHEKTELTRVNRYALVYRWRGADSGLLPLMLTAHYDVVPVEAGTEDAWKYPGFSGQVAEGRIWGRGTLDIKSQMIAHMEAAEALMREGFTPQRDFLFVYGQDEEIGGMAGASKVVERFIQEGVRLEGVIDEGGFVVSGVIKGVSAPLALVGVAEKGLCNYQLSLAGAGGHSSMPPPHTALGELAKVLTNIEKRPLPTRLTPPTLELLRSIAGEMGFVTRMAAANLWLFRPVLLKALTGNPATNALVRTTFAATMARASDAANVLPQRVQATVNVRLLPGDTVAGVAAYLKEAGGNPDLGVEHPLAAEPSKTSPTDSAVYQKIAQRVQSLLPGVIVTPYLVTGGTDARKYYPVSDNIYRFTPLLVSNEEKDAVHNTNESVSVENYGRMIVFFRQLIETFDAP